MRRLIPVAGVALIAVLLSRGALENDSPNLFSDSAVKEKSEVFPELKNKPLADQTESPDRELIHLNTHAPNPVVQNPTGTQSQDAPTMAFPAVEDEVGANRADEPVTVKQGNSLDAMELAAGPDADMTPYDTGVWPEREIINLGEVATDALGRQIEHEQRFVAQGSFGVYERSRAHASIPSESSSVYPLPGGGRLLEGPRLIAPGGFAKTETPTEAMRRFDEIRELRSLIDQLQSIAPADRTDVETGRLNALWYRLGSITSEPLLLDSAISVLGDYVELLDGTGATEWLAKRNELIEKRQTFDR